MFKLSEFKELLGDKYEAFKAAWKDAEDGRRAAEAERDQALAKATEHEAAVATLTKRVEDSGKDVDARIKAAEAERDKALAQAEAHKAEVAKAQESHEAFRLDQDVWEAARTAGLRDRSYLVHVPRDGIRRGKDGALEGLDDAIEAAKTKHAILFAEATPATPQRLDTGGNGPKPKATPAPSGDAAAAVQAGLAAIGVLPQTK